MFLIVTNISELMLNKCRSNSLPSEQRNEYSYNWYTNFNLVFIFVIDVGFFAMLWPSFEHND